MDSPFDVLGIDPDAEEGEIEQAYRRRVMETHPDHGGSAREFQRVTAAYEEITSGRAARTGAARPSDESENDDDPAEHRHERTDPRVEYLNYQVLEDHGWALEDDDLFEKAAAADLDPVDYGRITVEPRESLLQAAENRGFVWPYACRGGACANCAVAVTDGEMTMPVDHILPEELVERDIRLSCLGAPVTDTMQVVYNVKHLPDLDELRLKPQQDVVPHVSRGESDD